MRKFFGLLFLLLLVLVGVVLFNTITAPQSKLADIPPPTQMKISNEVHNRLAAAIQIPTISYEDTTMRNDSTMLRFHQMLNEFFPTTTSRLRKEIIDGGSLLYTWRGSSRGLKPILLMAHMDVVPVEDPTSWKEEPFSGKIDDTFIWGRGTLDDKNSVLGILEAVERLLVDGHEPDRTIFLAFGHDEEVLGNGAKAIVDHLQKQNIQLEYVLDEGMVVTQGLVPGISKDVALIGLSEKGFVNVELSVKGSGGHSSMPPHETAIGILSDAVHTLENNPMPQKLEGPLLEMFNRLGPDMPFHLRMVFANRWLFGSILNSQLSASPSTNASTRTTAAPTMLNASKKANVLPAKASAVINYRILPGETIDDVLAHVRKVVKDERVEVATVGLKVNPPTISKIDAFGYNAIETTIRQLYPETLVAPSLTVATTDSRHYTPICDNIYRFLPVRMTGEDLSRIHGSNERISKEDYKRGIHFYYQLIKNSGATTSPRP